MSMAMPTPRVLWLGSPVNHSFPLSQGQYNSNDGAISVLEDAGFLVDVCPTVDVAIQRIRANAGRNMHMAAVCSGGTDSTHLAFVTRLRRENTAIFLAVFDRDAAMSAESRTVLQGFPNATAENTISRGRGVDMVTCWTDHLIEALKEVVNNVAGRQELRERLKALESEIRKVFDHHDADNSGFIEEPEYFTFAVEISELLEPDPGQDRNVAINKVYETIKSIDTDTDGAVSFAEFWHFVTKPAAVKAPAAVKEEKPWHETFGAYVLVCCQKADGGFLIVHQKEGWWMPGTVVLPDETPHQAAERCCLEQAGLPIRLEGVLRVEFDSRSGIPGSRLRMVFLARALNDYHQLKTVPDKNSSGSVWVDGNKITVLNEHIPLAGNEPAVWADYVLRLGPVYPLSILASEGAPLVDQAPCAKAHVPFCTEEFGNPPFHTDGYLGSEAAGCSIEIGGELRSNLGVIYPNSP
eukprot:TRINITY_DN12007_c0_g1_i1.p1 TRINITY_DN12007_c0_g1~~TRINITY_DN12007_c0_g1_i1.p1  ORF type:complete len:466 (-),score=97.57 TRINITY_DN12007_c0_g1_i1:412-1809(-)